MSDGEVGEDDLAAELEQMTTQEHHREAIADALGTPLEAVRFMDQPVLMLWVSDAGDQWKIQRQYSIPTSEAVRLLREIADDWEQGGE